MKIHLVLLMITAILYLFRRDYILHHHILLLGMIAPIIMIEAGMDSTIVIMARKEEENLITMYFAKTISAVAENGVVEIGVHHQVLIEKI